MLDFTDLHAIIAEDVRQASFEDQGPVLIVGNLYEYTWPASWQQGTDKLIPPLTVKFTVTDDAGDVYKITFENGVSNMFSKTSPMHLGTKPAAGKTTELRPDSSVIREIDFETFLGEKHHRRFTTDGHADQFWKELCHTGYIPGSTCAIEHRIIHATQYSTTLGSVKCMGRWVRLKFMA